MGRKMDAFLPGKGCKLGFRVQNCAREPDFGAHDVTLWQEIATFPG
jgi:hypothetical protein